MIYCDDDDDDDDYDQYDDQYDQYDHGHRLYTYFFGEGVRDVDVEKSVGLSDNFVCFIGYDDGIFEFKL